MSCTSCASSSCSTCEKTGGSTRLFPQADAVKIIGDDGKTLPYRIHAEKTVGKFAYQLLLPIEEGYDATIIRVVTDENTGERFAFPTETAEEFEKALDAFYLEIKMLEDPLPMV